VISVGHDIASIVRSELNFNGVPHVAPVRVVILFFGSESHFGHKSEGFSEVFEIERAVQAIFFFEPHG
jgi:hypothetical protein